MNITEQDKKRFFAKVKINEETGCHEWTAHRHTFGYGGFKLNGKSYGAHRIAWVIANGPIPEGMCICHKCDNPCCVNHEHLFLGTHSDNMADKARKGRCPKMPNQKGEKHYQHRLSKKDVLKIRSMKETYATIAKMYGVSKSAIQHIKTKRTWKHI